MYRKIVFVALCFVFSHAYATDMSIDTVPTSWRLQNYSGDKVVAFFTGSACESGRLDFRSDATLGDKNRFWSVVLTAKVANKPVVVYYDASGAPSQCLISSFLLKEE